MSTDTCIHVFSFNASAHLCVYTYACLCVYVCVYVYVYLYVFMNVYICMHACLCARLELESLSRQIERVD